MIIHEQENGIGHQSYHKGLTQLTTEDGKPVFVDTESFFPARAEYFVEPIMGWERRSFVPRIAWTKTEKKTKGILRTAKTAYREEVGLLVDGKPYTGPLFFKKGFLKRKTEAVFPTAAEINAEDDFMSKQTQQVNWKTNKNIF